MLNWITLKMPVSNKLFMCHRIEFAQMLHAVKEIEVMNRTDITSLISRLEHIETNVLKIKKEDIKDDPMVR
jgi:hypothetical protein